MENLTLLEQEALEILKQLEYRCESIELHNPEYVKEKNFLEITFGDLNLPVLKKGENIYDIAKYLQKNGLDFSITFDLMNDSSITHIDNEHPTEDFIELGIIKGENIQSIKTKIKEIINKLAPKLEEKKKDEFRITKTDDDFYYKGALCTLSKDNDWYKVFCSVYDLIPLGGEIPYTKLGEQIKSKIKKTKRYDAKEMRKFIQTNLTDKSNGFMRYAKISANEDNGKPLLYVNRDKGIVFNNKLG